MIVLAKIISGGQTGADRAALDVARELGIDTGGSAPDHYLTEAGCDPTLAQYGLVALEGVGYSGRTKRNVLDSDATVLFGHTIYDGGTGQTLRLCIEHRKPHLSNPSPFELRVWLELYQIRVLNVAGHRESRQPGIGAIVKETIRLALVPLGTEPDAPEAA